MIALKPRFPIFFIFSLIFLVELLSFTAYFLPHLQPYILAASFLAVFLLSLSSLENGLLVAVVELVIGSKGHLFSFPIAGFPVSLRLAIWSALMIASVILIVRVGLKKSWAEYGRNFHYWPHLLVFTFFIVIGLVQGWLQGYPFATVLADANAWLFLSLIVPVLLAYGQADEDKLVRLRKYFFIALGWLVIKTLALLFIFSHNLLIMPDIYLWVRRSGIGEITAMGGGWQRVFIQSQVYAPIAYLIVLFTSVSKRYTRKKRLLIVFALSALMAVIVISMSRSFWLAFVSAAAIIAIYVWRLKWRNYLKALSYFLISLVGAGLLMFVVVRFPFPDPNAGLSAAALAERLDLTGDEAALSSRWSQLPDLWSAIKRSPLIGQGFGTSVSYYSQDPRVLAQHPDGLYTTYAFEWAYLDTWLKLGILGLLPFLAWIILQLSSWLRQGSPENPVASGLAAGLLCLAIVNIFTPYLNHPLGLAFLLFSSCFFQKKQL